MKILLIAPSQKQIYGEKVSPPYPPLGLLQIGAVLKSASHEVKFIDLAAEDYDDIKLIDEIKDFDPSLVCLTCVTPTFGEAIRVAGIVKNNSSAWTVLGGVHPTIAPDECFKSREIDFLVVGEGELTIIELIAYLQKREKTFSPNGLLRDRIRESNGDYY